MLFRSEVNAKEFKTQTIHWRYVLKLLVENLLKFCILIIGFSYFIYSITVFKYLFWYLILNASQTCICDNEMLLSQPCCWYHASTRSRRAQRSQDYVSSHWLLLLCQYLTNNQLTPIWWNPDFTICIWLSLATWQFLFVWYLFLFFNVKLFFFYSFSFLNSIILHLI